MCQLITCYLSRWVGGGGVQSGKMSHIVRKMGPARYGWCKLRSHHILAWQLLTLSLQKTKQPIMPSTPNQYHTLRIQRYRHTH